MRICLFIGIFIAGFLLIHAAKFMRLYLVLLEQKIPFFQFVRVYCKTTFINLVIPFKLGEIYRVYCFSKLGRSLEVGIFSVLADRFFDTLALLLLLLPFELVTAGRIQAVTAVLTVLLLVVLFAYRTFPGMYAYLNHYIIQKKSSGRSLAVLKGLEYTNIWYAYVRELVRGRYALIFFFSLLGWLLETGLLWALSMALFGSFGAGDFSAYISAIFLAGSSGLLTAYVRFSALLLGVAAAVLYGIYGGRLLLLRRRKHSV